MKTTTRLDKAIESVSAELGIYLADGKSITKEDVARIYIIRQNEISLSATMGNVGVTGELQGDFIITECDA